MCTSGRDNRLAKPTISNSYLLDLEKQLAVALTTHQHPNHPEVIRRKNRLFSEYKNAINERRTVGQLVDLQRATITICPDKLRRYLEKKIENLRGVEKNAAAKAGKQLTRTTLAEQPA